MCSLHILFQFIISEQVTLYFCLLCLVYCIVGIILCHFVSHISLFILWLRFMVQCTSAFYLSSTDLCKVSNEDSYHSISQLSLLLRLKVIAYIYSVLYLSRTGLTCSMLACRLLTMLVCITRCLYI